MEPGVKMAVIMFIAFTPILFAMIGELIREYRRAEEEAHGHRHRDK